MTIGGRTFICNAVFVAAAIFATGSHAQAGFIMTIQQVGNNVVETGSGTINLSALTFIENGLDQGGVGGSIGYAAAGPYPTISNPDDVLYSGISGPTSFGSGAYLAASSGSGPVVDVYGANGTLVVPTGYVSGAALSDTSTFINTTLAGLGLTTGDYIWTWGTGATADSFQVQIGTPEPSTFGLLALAAAGLMLGCHLRRTPVVKMDAACSSPSGRISLTEL